MSVDVPDVVSRSGSSGRRSEVIATELGYLWSSMLRRGAMEAHRSIGLVGIGENETFHQDCAARAECM